MVMSDYQASAGQSKHLSALATSYIADYTQYVTEQVALPLHQTGIISGNFQRNQASWSDLESDLRTTQQPAVQLDDEDPELISFKLDDHAVRAFISERYLLNRAQAGVSKDRVIADQVRRITGNLLTQREKRLANIITNSANYNSNNSGAVSNTWGSANGTPIDDVLAAIATVAKGPAKSSDYYLVADESVWITLLGAKQIRSAIGGLAFAPDYETVGRILHVHPIIAKAAYNKGSTSFFGNNAVLFKRPAAVSNDDESAECSWRLVTNTSSPISVRQYTTDELADNGFYVEGKANYQFIQPFGDSAGKQNTAFLLTGVVS